MVSRLNSNPAKVRNLVDLEASCNLTNHVQNRLQYSRERALQSLVQGPYLLPLPCVDSLSTAQVRQASAHVPAASHRRREQVEREELAAVSGRQALHGTVNVRGSTGSDWQLSSAAPRFGRARALPAELKAGLHVALNSGPSIAEVVAEERERRTALCQEIHRNEAESDHSRLVGDFVKLLTECLTLCQLLFEILRASI